MRERMIPVQIILVAATIIAAQYAQGSIAVGHAVPGIVILVVQQTFLLGIGLLFGEAASPVFKTPSANAAWHDPI